MKKTSLQTKYYDGDYLENPYHDTRPNNYSAEIRFHCRIVKETIGWKTGEDYYTNGYQIERPGSINGTVVPEFLLSAGDGK